MEQNVISTDAELDVDSLMYRDREGKWQPWTTPAHLTEALRDDKLTVTIVAKKPVVVAATAAPVSVPEVAAAPAVAAAPVTPATSTPAAAPSSCRNSQAHARGVCGLWSRMCGSGAVPNDNATASVY